MTETDDTRAGSRTAREQIQYAKSRALAHLADDADGHAHERAMASLVEDLGAHPATRRHAARAAAGLAVAAGHVRGVVSARRFVARIGEVFEEVSRATSQAVRPAPDAATLRTMLCAAKGEMRALWMLAILLGLRGAELSALCWRHLTLDTDTDTDTGLDGGGGDAMHRVEIHDGAVGSRWVPLPPATAAALRAHRDTTRPATGDELVFTTRNGNPLTRPFLHRQVTTLARQAGTSMSFHDLRRGTIIALLQLGVRDDVVGCLVASASLPVHSPVSDHELRAAVQRFETYLTAGDPQ